MPRYHFIVPGRPDAIDKRGFDLSGDAEAGVEAVRLAGALIAQHADGLPVGKAWRMDVIDAAGLMLFHLEFKSIRAPLRQIGPFVGIRALAEDAPFYEGQNAFDRGDLRLAHPYHEASDAGRMWLDGWDEARRYTEHLGETPISV